MLKNINISNYRVIKHLSLDNFASINIFTGAANSGKSSILEAIYFLCNNNINSLNHILKIRNFTDEPDMFKSFFYDYDINKNISIKGYNNKNIVCNINAGKNIIYENTESWLNNIVIEYDSSSLVENYKYSAYFDNDFKLNINLEDSLMFNNSSAEYIAAFSCYDTLKNNLTRILINNNSKKELIKYIKIFDENIEDIIFIGNIISVAYKYLANAVNIKAAGKGFYSYLTIIAAVLSGSKIIIIDEIENGIHFSLLGKLINNIIDISLKDNIQFFISTHSKEFLEIFNKNIKNKEINAKIYNLYYKNNNINHIDYTNEQFYSMIENQNEIRD